MNILPLLAISLETKLKEKRRQAHANKLFLEDMDSDVFNLNQKIEVIDKQEAEILMLERCYALVVIAIKNPEIGERYEAEMLEKTKELDLKA